MLETTHTSVPHNSQGISCTITSYNMSKGRFRVRITLYQNFSEAVPQINSKAMCNASATKKMYEKAR